MKRAITFLLVLLMATPLWAQEEEKKSQENVPEIPEVETTGNPGHDDSTVVTINNRRIILINHSNSYNDDDEVREEHTVSFFGSDRNRVWRGFNFGFSDVSYSVTMFDNNVPIGTEFFDVNMGNSIAWEINPFELDVRIINEYVKFSTGLGYMVKNFSLANNYLLYKDSNNVVTGRIETEHTLNKNRFRTGYITLPAFLYFNTSKDPERAFRIGGGIIGGINILQTYRIKTFTNGHKNKAHQNGSWNTNTFMLDWRGIIGFGPVNLYVSHSLLPLFQDNKGPEVYPFNFGISFVSIW